MENIKNSFNCPEYIVFNTDMGWIGVLGSAKGLLRVSLPRLSATGALEALGDIAKEVTYTTGRLEDVASRLRLYFGGQPMTFPDELDLSGATPFQREVWRQTRLIPRAETRSYRWLAEQTGRPGAARAVGQALARNPLPVIIPCHRVISKSGHLGGFSNGTVLKRRLLDLESSKTN
jgi:O-6-methylguanine DNA methyltransferase